MTNTTESREPETAPVAPTIRLGVFGGTFDPPHNGHLHVAREAKAMLHLDAVALMVTNISWQKRYERHVTAADVRWQLVQAACEDQDNIWPCRMEIDRGGESYSIQTIRELQERHPTAELFFIVGRDAALNLPTWHEWEEILEQTTLVVVNRPEPTDDDDESRDDTSELSAVLGDRFTYLEIPPIPISSTALRDRFRSQEPTELMTPEPVRFLVQELGLYQNTERGLV